MRCLIDKLKIGGGVLKICCDAVSTMVLSVYFDGGGGGPVFLCQIAVSHHGVSALSTGDPPELHVITCNNIVT